MAAMIPKAAYDFDFGWVVHTTVSSGTLNVPSLIHATTGEKAGQGAKNFELQSSQGSPTRTQRNSAYSGQNDGKEGGAFDEPNAPNGW
jgi:hypothetical protein